MKSLELFGFFY